MRRALWKGAISFGLINIPVELYTAEKREELDFTMLDRRDLAPVGYKRVNKQTGREVAWEDIVKGYEYEEGKYVLMSDEDLRRANVEATQTVDIESFVDAAQIPVLYYEQPYYLAPDKGGEKAYNLLRETLRASGKMAIAQIVIRTRQHLAALMPEGDMLNLITLRYPTELRAPDDLPVPSAKARKSAVSAQEVEMARALVEHMSAGWTPEAFRDTYRDDVLAMIRQKIKRKQTHQVAQPEEAAAAPSGGAKVVDLMALLKNSLSGKGRSKKSASPEKEAGTAPKRARKSASVHKMPDRQKAAASRKSSTGKSAKGAAKVDAKPAPASARTRTARAAAGHRRAQA